MKPAILKKWVRALRSGRYKQGKHSLKIINGIPRYCCLGVLCDLHAKAKGRRWVKNEYLGAENILPGEVVIWAGLGRANPKLVEGLDGDGTAAGINDSGKRFKTIAKLIEQAQKNRLI